MPVGVPAAETATRAAPDRRTVRSEAALSVSYGGCTETAEHKNRSDSGAPIAEAENGCGYPARPSAALSHKKPTLATYRTASGTWRVRRSGAGFVWTLDENPGWSSAMACNDTETSSTVAVDRWTLLVAPHACKFAQDAAPVELDAALIRDAVDSGRWVAYRSERADPWPAYFGQAGELERLSATRYDPAAMNGESSSSNFVGVISGQGGEYTTSRGASDEIDAQIVAMALDGQPIAPHTDTLYDVAFASAGFPHRTPFVGTALRDPQRPIEGLQYEYRIGGTETTDKVYSALPLKNWKYDAAHLANSGWALWLATEDPRIGMIVQSHAAFSLATYPEYKREHLIGADGHMSHYRCNASQNRAHYNCLNAMWRARDVARRVRSDDTMVWSEQRVERMYADTVEQSREVREQISGAAPDSGFLRALRVTSSPLLKAVCARFYRPDGSTFPAITRSNFMDQQYGAVPVYLRANAGEPLGRDLMEAMARHMVARTLYIGGAAGIDGRRDLKGSSFPLGPCQENGKYLEPAPLPFDDRRGWAQWVEAQQIVDSAGVAAPTNTLQGSSAHTAIQTDFILRAARDLQSRGLIEPIEDLDAAIAALESARDATALGQMRFKIWFKHAHSVATDETLARHPAAGRGGRSPRAR